MGEENLPLEERFVRWQSQAMRQLSVAINLFVGFAVAGLGFAVSFLRDLSFAPTRCYAVIYLLSLVLFGIAVLLGAGATVTRLLDFRSTARRVRLRQIDPTSSELVGVTLETGRLGKATWRLFWFLSATFLLAVVALSISLFSVYGSHFLQRAGL
jgi:hypothetical protein